jgi:hypothetical protein
MAAVFSCLGWMAGRTGSEQLPEVVAPDFLGRLQRAVEQVAAAVVVVGLALVGVRQHFVGLLHGPKARGCVRRWVFVGMPEGGLLAKGFFNVGQRRGAVQPKGSVVIGHAVSRLVLPAPKQAGTARGKGLPLARRAARQGARRGPVIMLDAPAAPG